MPQARSPYHAIAYQRPEGFKRPSVIFDAQRVIEDAQYGRGGLGKLLSRLPVRGGKERQRAARSDALKNRCTLLQAIVAHTDISSGVVVAQAPTDMPNGARFLEPMSAAKLTEIAYGGLVDGEVSIERANRGLHDLAELGLVTLREQCEQLDNGDFLNLPSIKTLTDEFWRVVRLWTTVCRLRGKNASEKAVKKLQAIIAGVARRQGKRRAERSVSQSGAAKGDPAVVATAAAAYRVKAQERGLRGAALEASLTVYLRSLFKP